MVEFYVAILAANRAGEIFATVPDLPGANSAAPTRGEALRLVTEFADDYVRDLIKDGHPVPPARSIDEIEIDPEDAELGRALIPVEIPGKSVKVTISIDEAVLKRVDQAAAQVGESRSGYFASAAVLRMQGTVTTLNTAAPAQSFGVSITNIRSGTASIISESVQLGGIGSASEIEGSKRRA